MDVHEELDRLRLLYRSMDDRVTELEKKRERKSRANRKEWQPDEVGQKVLDFLHSAPGIKFNSGTVTANVGETVFKVSQRLQTLKGRKLIQSDGKARGQGGYEMYWVEKPEPEFAEGPLSPGSKS